MSNGILAGLVSITSVCSSAEPWAALVCGCVGGILYYYAVALLEKLRIDDVVLAIPVHCFCGTCAYLDLLLPRELGFLDRYFALLWCWQGVCLLPGCCLHPCRPSQVMGRQATVACRAVCSTDKRTDVLILATSSQLRSCTC